MEREYNPNPNVREAGGAEARTWDEQLPSGRQSTGASLWAAPTGRLAGGLSFQWVKGHWQAIPGPASSQVGFAREGAG